MSIQFNYINTDDFKSLTFVVDGNLHVVNSDHPRFDEIFADVNAGDESVVDKVEILAGISREFKRVTERVSVAGGNVYFDGDPVNGVLANQIIRFYDDNADYMPLVNFMEKVNQNPNEHSREHLYRWLSDRDFTVTEDGDFIAYKGLTDDLHSIHSGPGIVNGVQESGQLDNTPGNVIEMARSSVTFDPNNGCSFGLHVGTWSYASSFGQRTVSVVVNPRDVVSVPSDCNDEKMRVCRYKVIETIEDSYQSYLYSYEPDEDEDDFEDEQDYSDPWSNTISVGVNPSPNTTTITWNNFIDTSQNYKKQARDSRGRFVK